MPHYTRMNLATEVEDQAPRYGFGEIGEARFARDALGCEKTGVSLQKLKPGVRQAFGHAHEHQEEIYVVIGGSGQIKVEDDVVELSRLDAVRVAPDARRQFEAGPNGLEFIAFGAPYTGRMDAEMLPGWWV